MRHRRDFPRWRRAAQDPQAGEQLAKAACNRLNCNEMIITELSIGVAANLGPGTVGVVAYPAEGG